MNGLFDLDDLFDESTDMEDLMNLEINMEDAEFAVKNPATNPTMDIDKDATGAHDINVPIPGGLKETPNAKPYDQTSISVPGGLSETPTAKPHDAMSISVPSGTTLSSSVYNDALTKLQKSYKESIETLELMKQITVLDESYDDILLESFDNDEKSDVKRLAKQFKSIIENYEGKLNYKWRPYSSWETLKAVIKSVLPFTQLFDIWTSGFGTLFKRVFSMNGFQIVGIMLVKNNDINSIMSQINKKHVDDLEGYKLFADPIISTFGINILKYKSYLIYIDKKPKNILSENLKSANDKFAADPKVKEAVKNKSTKDAKTESSEFNEEVEAMDESGKRKKKKKENSEEGKLEVEEESGKRSKKKAEKECEGEECVKEEYELDLDMIDVD